MIRTARALGKRDFRRYFANPIGYVFITLFIFLSAVAAFWRPRFFLNNLATLDQINEVFPLLLLFFVSALTMGVWAEERKAGSDELLLTLPASDFEIVLGKFLAVVGIYTIALMLSLSHVLVLNWLGAPDPGLMAANYLGYWVAGIALIAVGMFGSLLTSNTAIAFVLATLTCSVPVLIAAAAATFSDRLGRLLEPLAITDYFNQFARGIISLEALVYFVMLAGLFLYLNVLLLSRRHWRRHGEVLSTSAHHAVRLMMVVVALVSVHVITAQANLRFDVTAEHIHTLSDETRRLVADIPSNRHVSIQAFISPEVPREYVQQRESVLNVLREIAAIAPDRIQLIVDDTQPYSPSARSARERFGIVPRLVTDAITGGTDATAVFLGVAVTSGSDEQVIPFFEHGLAAEYEITRAIRVAARSMRKRIGIIDADVKILGGVDYDAGRTRLSWGIVEELRRQYDVIQVTPWEPIADTFDALLVVQPSRLLVQELEHTMAATRRGVPTLMILDPMPTVDMRLAPAAAMAARQDPYLAEGQAVVRKNTGDIQTALAGIGVSWPAARIAWDSYRPHPEMSDLPQEVVFVGTGSGNPHAFDASHPESAGLQDLPLMFPGYLTPAEGTSVKFEPLLQTGSLSGTASYFQLVQPTPAGPVLKVDIPHQPEGRPLILAAHLHGSEGPRPLNAIVVADLDFISDQIFSMRAQSATGANFDNVTFFLNCIDVLAGDESFIELRKRRVRYRTLSRVEAQTRNFVERLALEEQQARAESETALSRARGMLEQSQRSIESRTDIDAQAKQIMVRNLVETENRKLRVLQVNVEQARDLKIEASREAMESGIRRIQGTIRTTAVMLPPLPILVLGAAVAFRRRRNERRSAAALRRLRDVE